MAPPNSSAFKQQTLKAWRPILTPKLVILLFALGGLIFIPVGVIVIGASNGVTEIVSEDYSASCCIANCDSQIPWERVDANRSVFRRAFRKSRKPSLVGSRIRIETRRWPCSGTLSGRGWRLNALWLSRRLRAFASREYTLAP